MKFKERKRLFAKGRDLVVDSEKTDVLDYKDMELLAAEELPVFVPFSYERKHDGFSFRYDFGEAPALVDCRKAAQEKGALKQMALSMLDLLKRCEENKLPIQRVSFKPERVMRADDGGLRFVYVPARSFNAGSCSFQTCLQFVSEELSYQDPDDANLAKELYAFAMKTSIVSSIDFEGFLVSVGVVESSREKEAAPEVPKMSFASASGSFGWNFASQGREAVLEPAAGVAKPSSYFLYRASTGEGWRLAEGETVLGRSDECDIVIQGAPKVSRKHARLVAGKTGLTIQDLGSTNGVKVDGVRIDAEAPQVLAIGDAFTIGGELFGISE